MADGSEGPEKPERRPWIGTYILRDDHIAIPEYDTETWARWMEKHGTNVRWSQFGSWQVSTIFLGLDYGHMNGGPPLLFETMAFWKDLRVRRRFRRLNLGVQLRYSTWADSIAGHLAVLRIVHLMAAHKLRRDFFKKRQGLIDLRAVPSRAADTQ